MRDYILRNVIKGLVYMLQLAKILKGVLMRIIPLLVGLGVSLSANEQLLEIYTNKAFLKQRLEVGSGEVSIKVPVMANMESLFLKSARSEERRVGKEC